MGVLVGDDNLYKGPSPRLRRSGIPISSARWAETPQPPQPPQPMGTDPLTAAALSDEPLARAGHVGWVQLGPILLVHFCGTLGFSIALPFLVFLVVDFGGAPWTYGLVGATYSAAQLFGAPLLGRWSDRAGRGPVLVLSQAGTTLAWLLFLLALKLPLRSLGEFAGAQLTLPLLLVFLARLLDGLTGGNISVANAYVADLTRGEESARQVAFGRMGMAASLGFTLGPALAGLLGALGDGYTAPVIAAIAISALGTLLCLTLREPSGRCSEGPPAAATVSQVLGQQPRRCDRSSPEQEPGLLRQPGVAGLLLATFVLFLAFNLFYASFPLHATQGLGWSPVRMGLFYALMSAAMFVMQGPVLQWTARRLAPRSLFILGLAGLLLAFSLFPVAASAAAFAGALLFAFGNGLAWPTFQARMAGAATQDSQGALQGASASVGALASIIGLTAGGIAYPLLGGRIFLLGAGLFALVLLAAPALFPARRART